MLFVFMCRACVAVVIMILFINVKNLGVDKRTPGENKKKLLREEEVEEEKKRKRS